MNDNNLDKLFQNTLSIDQTFDRKVAQWKIVKGQITQRNKALIYWIMGFCSLLFAGFTILNSLESSENLTPIMSENSVELNQENNENNLGILSETEEKSEQESEILNTQSDLKKLDQKAIQIKEQKSNVTQNNSIFSIPKVPANTRKAGSIFQDSQIIIEEKESHDKLVEEPLSSSNNYYNQPNPNKQNYGNEESRDKLIEGIVLEEADQSFTYLQTLALESLSSSSILSNYKVDLYPQIIHVEKPELKTSPIGIYAGLTYAYSANNDLSINNPYSPKIGLSYKINKTLSIRTSYQHNPIDINISSNFDKYNLDYVGSYEPLDWSYSEITGQSHNLSVGVLAGINIGKWQPYLLINSNLQYLLDINEKHTFDTAYQQFSLNEQISNSFNFSTISPGVGLKYNFRKTAISLEYEYFYPFASLYNWTGIQNINLFVHYNL